MVYKRSLPPPTVRAIRKNQDIISKRNMAVDAGKSAYVRGKYNGLVEVPRKRSLPSKPTNPRRNTDPGMNPRENRRNAIISRTEAARARAISTNQGIVSARNMAADAGRSTYVRGKNNGLVDVPNVFKRRSPQEMDPGFNPRNRRVPTPTPGGRGYPRGPRVRPKPGDRRA